MAQRPRISQLKRTDVNFRTFKEQYETLEAESKHMRAPVMTRGELPMTGNLNGSQCLVISEGAIYYWDEDYQNWRSALGRTFELPQSGIRRYKKTHIAEEGQTQFQTGILFNVGFDEIDVYIQGILQDVNVDYYELDNRTIEFKVPLEQGMEVTIATPMIIQQSITLNTLEKRLEEIEYNHYQMMMNQYYSGKPIDAKGMVYDGFLNTDYIDYALTSANIQYDNILKTMRLKNETLRKIIEQFDTTTNIDPTSTVFVSSSEMTLPISTAYTTAFVDDFSTQDFIDLELTSAYHDLEDELITTVDTFAGGDHYYKGDFMTTTESADRIGFNETISILDYYYDRYSRTNYYIYHNQYADCYAVLPMGSMTGIFNSIAGVWRNSWPYSSTDHFYRDGIRQNYRTDGYVRDSYYGGNYNWYQNVYSLMPTDDSQNYRATTTYVRAWDKIIALRQYGESSGRYYQRLASAPGRTSSLTWTWYGRPPGLPNTMFGSETKTYSDSRDMVDQIGSTYDNLLLRVDDKLYFLDSSLNVVKTLDWSSATRKPSLYNVASRQITADGRYLYFPARLYRDGYYGYFIEVFDIVDGSFVNEILVSRDNAGSPGTTAMGFDHDYNRLVIGQKGGEWLNLYGKSYYSNYVNTSYAGFLSFQAPDLNERELHSKPITTNLPRFRYQLSTSHQLNGGEVHYYIRFNDEAYTKINPGTVYTWTNPNGAKETKVQLRAVLRTTLNAITAPTLTNWELKVQQFVNDALFKTKTQLLDLDGVTGGKLLPNQTVPSETSLNWSIQYDTGDPEYPIAQDGSFSAVDNLAQGYVSVYARLGTNNTLLSPVVRDFQAQLYEVAAGVLVTQTFNQIDDIAEASMWVTTGASHDYYRIYMSRNNGATWVQARKDTSTKQPDGKVETLWKCTFSDGDDVDRRNFKIKFEIDGATEIHQYGAMLN